MSMNTQIHQIRSIEETEVNRLAVENRVVYVKEIAVFTNKGEKFCLTLFSETPEALRIETVKERTI